MFLKVNSVLLLLLFLHQYAFGYRQAQKVREIKLQYGYPLVALLNFTELATKYGYVAEQHSVTTEDGYINTMFRITKGKNCHRPLRKPPVLIVHGLLMSSDSFMTAGPKAGLAYLISDLCYDLWVPNLRGNCYSKKHTNLDPAKDREYWDFYNIEFGYYDMPAFINYVLKHTASDKINYIGYSQGGGNLFILNSERPEYNNKIGVGILLEPSSRHTYTRSPLFRLLANAYRVGSPLLHTMGIFEALPLGGVVQEVASFLCKNYIIADTICRFSMSLFDSFHPGSITTETIRVFFGHFPAGTSVKNLAWFGQAMNNEVFQYFDYGASINLQLYGTTQPPAYNLSAVTVPTVVIHGRNDFVTSPADVDWITTQLPNVLEMFYVVDPLWNHIDAIGSQYVGTRVMPKIGKYLEKFSEP